MIEQKSTSVVDQIEREIARLRRARPELESRIVRAESILVTQLSVSAARPVRVKLHPDGTRSYAVHSCSRISRTYSVTGEFVCDCPDTRRRHSGVRPPACKHAIACYVLDRALLRSKASRTSPCSACGERVHNRELTEVQDWHESLTWFEGDVLCGRCLTGSDCW